MKIQETMARVIDKGFSGRFICLTSIAVTYCVVIILVLVLVVKKIIGWEAFVGIFTPFALIAQDVVQSYFNRTDRYQPEKENPNETTPLASGPIQ